METFGGELPKHPLLVKQNLIEVGVCETNYALDSDQKIEDKELLEE